MKLSTVLCATIFFIGQVAIQSSAALAETRTHETQKTPEEKNQKEWHKILNLITNNLIILTKKNKEIIKLLKSNCDLSNTENELTCINAPEIRLISIEEGPLGAINLRIKPPATCDEILTIISNKFGAGKSYDNNKCNTDWNTNKWVKKSYIAVRSGKSDSTEIRMQFAIEVGP